MPVKIVTDSSSDIPPAIARELDITVLPLYLRFGDKTYRDGVDISPEEFYRRLQDEPAHPATSAISPGDFVRVYDSLAGDADGIVSIHLSQRVSATYDAAVQASSLVKNKDCPVEVIDSRFVTIALGLVTMAAARAALSGKGVKEIVKQVHALIPCMRVYGVLDTLKYVLKGGRLGRVGPYISSVLPIKPVLTMKQGKVAPIGAARTRSKAMDRLCELVGSVPMVQEIGIAHSTTEDELREFIDRIKSIIPAVKPVIASLGPALGVHGGPGAILVGIQQDIEASGERESADRKALVSLPSLKSIKEELQHRIKRDTIQPSTLQVAGV